MDIRRALDEHELVAHLVAQIERIEELVEQVLDVTRVDPKRDVDDVHPAASDVLAVCRGRIARRDDRA